MKLFKLLTVISFIVLFASANMFAASIVGSKHDFSVAPNTTWNTSGEICLPCHTPHNGNMANAPLWNHATSTATYTLYTNAVSGTLNATTGQPDGNSKACLSCHDNSVALQNFGGVTTGTNFIATQAAASNLGTDLSNDHPISFTYDAALATADGELKNPMTSPGIGTKAIDSTMLFNHKVQCASCHDPHNTPGITHLLRKSNAASALCLTCHNK